MAPSGKRIAKLPNNAISLPDVQSAVESLQDLLGEVSADPMHRLALYLHSEFCNDRECNQSRLECSGGINWVDIAEGLLEELSSIFPGEEQKKPAKRSRKLQLDKRDEE